MAQAIKTLIINDIVSTLETVQTGGGSPAYQRTLRAVSRKRKSLMEAQRDMVYVESLGEKKSDWGNNVTESTMTVGLFCVIQDMDDLPTAMDDVTADITRALLADEKRNQNAISTEILTVLDSVDDDAEPTGTVSIEVKVVYRHKRTDPTVRAG